MKSKTEAAIRAASKAAFHGGLRDAGFRRQGNHLHRQSGGLIHAVNFQASRGMALPLGAFTVNLLVTSEYLYLCWAGRTPVNPATMFFPIQQRIGLLMPQREDRWWPVDGGIDGLCREVSRALVQYGLPFFETFPSADALLALLRSGSTLPGVLMTDAHLLLAMLAKEKGLDDEATAQLRRALEKAGASSFRDTVLRIAERLRLAVT
jgi:Domain of unknown function (DUF4304)